MLLSKDFSGIGYAQLVSGEEQTPLPSFFLEEVAPKVWQPGQRPSLSVAHSLVTQHTICVYVVQGCISGHMQAGRSLWLNQVSVTQKTRRESTESRF